MPKWNQAFDIDVKYVGDDMTIQVFDEDVTASDLVRRYNIAALYFENVYI